MTIQTKRFIELTDILALRFTCKHCGATLSLSITDDKLMREQPTMFLGNCPGCQRPWTNFGGSTNEQLITRVTAALNRLREALAGNPPMPFGFSLGVEITPETIPGTQQQ